MASFKLSIADPSSGKTFQKEVKDDMAKSLVGLNIGETLKGDSIELPGFELQITGGSDYCGFPMRKGILGARKVLKIYGGIGFRGHKFKGTRKRKTICGHKINEKITQINLKVTKQGSKKLADIFGGGEAKEGAEKPAEAPKEEKKEAPKAEPKPKEEKKAEPKSEKAAEKPKEAEAKPAEAKPAEKPKADAKK